MGSVGFHDHDVAPIADMEAFEAYERDRQARRRRQATIGFAIAGGLFLLAAFSHAVDLLIAVPAIAYSVYLYRGGTVVLWGSLRPRQRSLAWIYYSIITVVAAIFGVSVPIFFVIALATGAYSIYLYRGGRWVLWLW